MIFFCSKIIKSFISGINTIKKSEKVIIFSCKKEKEIIFILLKSDIRYKSKKSK